MRGCMRMISVVALWAAVTVGAVAAPVNKSLLGGLAVKGTDVVAYFTEGQAVAGNAAYTHAWQAATWRFASAAHRDQFVTDPEKFAPQYGGYCAWAMSQNKKAPIDPEAWRIVDGKLYLNYSADIQAKWLKDVPGLIAKADEFWKTLAEK